MNTSGAEPCNLIYRPRRFGNSDVNQAMAFEPCQGFQGYERNGFCAPAAPLPCGQTLVPELDVSQLTESTAVDRYQCKGNDRIKASVESGLKELCPKPAGKNQIPIRFIDDNEDEASNDSLHQSVIDRYRPVSFIEPNIMVRKRPSDQALKKRQEMAMLGYEQANLFLDVPRIAVDMAAIKQEEDMRRYMRSGESSINLPIVRRQANRLDPPPPTDEQQRPINIHDLNLLHRNNSSSSFPTGVLSSPVDNSSCGTKLLTYDGSSLPPQEALSDSEVQNNRRFKRLARNRASARTRREKKKTMTDSLQQDVDDLLESIQFLKTLQAYRKMNDLSKSTLENLNYPCQILRKAHESYHGTSDGTALAKQDHQCEQKSERLEFLTTRHRAILSNPLESAKHGPPCCQKLQDVLLRHLVLGKTSRRFIHSLRRACVIKSFIGMQSSMVKELHDKAAANLLFLEPCCPLRKDIMRRILVQKTSSVLLESCRVKRPNIRIALPYMSNVLPEEASCESPSKRIRNDDPILFPQSADKSCRTEAFQTVETDEQTNIHSETVKDVASSGENGPTTNPLQNMKNDQKREPKITGDNDPLSKSNARGAFSPKTPKCSSVVSLPNSQLKPNALSRQQVEEIRKEIQKIQVEHLCLYALLRVSTSMAVDFWVKFPLIQQTEQKLADILRRDQIERLICWSEKFFSHSNCGLR